MDLTLTSTRGSMVPTARALSTRVPRTTATALGPSAFLPPSFPAAAMAPRLKTANTAARMIVRRFISGRLRAGAWGLDGLSRQYVASRRLFPAWPRAELRYRLRESGAGRSTTTPQVGRSTPTRSRYVSLYITHHGARPAGGSARLFRPPARHRPRRACRQPGRRVRGGPRVAGTLPGARAGRPRVPRSREKRARSLPVPRAQTVVPALPGSLAGQRERCPGRHGAGHRSRGGGPGPHRRARHPARDVPPRSGAPPRLDRRRQRAGGDGDRGSRPPGGRGGPGRDGLYDGSCEDRPVSLAAISSAGGAGSVHEQSPFRGRF